MTAKGGGSGISATNDFTVKSGTLNVSATDGEGEGIDCGGLIITGGSITAAGNPAVYTQNVTLGDDVTVRAGDDEASAKDVTKTFTNDHSGYKWVQTKEAIKYPLWVGGVQVTSANYSGENWSYNAGTKTLRLNGTIEGSGEFDDGTGEFDCGIYSNIPDLTINVVTHSTVRGSGTKAYSYGIRAVGCKLTITGDGKLTAEGGSGNDAEGASGYTYGIAADSITLEGMLEAIGGRSQHESASYGLETGEIKGNGELTAIGDDAGINAMAGGLTIDGATVTAEGGVYGIRLGTSVVSDSNITIREGSSVTASGTKTGIYGNVKNEIAGTGWTDTEGTEGMAAIAVSTEGRSLPDYRKVRFPEEGGYSLWVGSTRVTEENKDDILGDGGSAVFDPETNTLTLDDPEISDVHSEPNSTSSEVIYSLMKEKLTIKGKAVLTGTPDRGKGIYAPNSDIELDGDFVINAGYEGIGANTHEVTISGGNVTVEAAIGIDAGAFSITGGKLTVDASGTAIVAYKGITIGDGLSIVEPEGGRVETDEYGDKLVDADGNTADYVIIRPYEETFTVSFDANGGSGTMKDVTEVSGEYELPECLFKAPEGKTFDCWLAEGKEYQAGDKITVEADVTVKAQWKDTEAHEHKLTLVKEKKANCTEAGNKAYYTCSGCDLWFEDATGIVEITDKSSVVTSALGHKWGAWKQTKAPTASEEGEESRVCSRCGEKETRSVPRSDDDKKDDDKKDDDKKDDDKKDDDKKDDDKKDDGKKDDDKKDDDKKDDGKKRGSSSDGDSSDSGSSSSYGSQGRWRQAADGWYYDLTAGGQATGWKYLQYNNRYDWYYFNENGLMQTGWLDYNGSRYYLNPVSDGWKGAMFTGWHQIEGKWYYFETVSGKNQGHLYVDTTTPDGYHVGADGAWDGNPANRGR